MGVSKFVILVLVVLVRYVRVIVPIASWEVTRNNFCFIVCLKLWTDLLHSCQYPMSGADEVSRESLQLVTATTHDESVGLILCDAHEAMTALNSCHVLFRFC
jgi:hypothetical protein